MANNQGDKNTGDEFPITRRDLEIFREEFSDLIKRISVSLSNFSNSVDYFTKNTHEQGTLLRKQESLLYQYLSLLDAIPKVV